MYAQLLAVTAHVLAKAGNRGSPGHCYAWVTEANRTIVWEGCSWTDSGTRVFLVVV